MEPDPTRADLVAEAWRLAAKERRSVREVARTLGIPKTTAQDYIREGREAEGWLELFDVAQHRGDAEARLGEYLRRAMEWLERAETASEAASMFGVLLAIEARLARMLGLDRPSRVAIGRDEAPKGVPDHEVMEAVARAARASADDEAALRRGTQRGVIEGSAGD